MLETILTCYNLSCKHCCTQLFNVVKKPSYLTQLNPVINVVIFNYVMKTNNWVSLGTGFSPEITNWVLIGKTQLTQLRKTEKTEENWVK